MRSWPGALHTSATTPASPARARRTLWRKFLTPLMRLRRTGRSDSVTAGGEGRVVCGECCQKWDPAPPYRGINISSSSISSLQKSTDTETESGKRNILRNIRKLFE